MPQKYRYIAISCSVLFTLAVFLFFGFSYAYHIHYQEQLQLFQFTCAYFGDVSAVPGGFADWCGRFLTQFFFYARAGAAIISLLLAAVQLLTYVCIGRKTLMSYALSFIPALLLFLFFLDENAIVGAAVSLILCLSAAVGVKAVRNPSFRIALLLAGVPLMYFLCGPIALVFVLLSLRGEHPAAWSAALLLYAACPLVSQYIFPYPLESLLKGIHYYRYPSVLPLWLSLAVISELPVCAAGHFRLPSGRADAITGASVAAVLAALAFFATDRSADMVKEEVMCYDFMVQHRMWNRIMMTADKKNPSAPMSVCCLNLALSQTGRLSTDMFDYFQNGPEGLLPGFARDFTSPIPTGEVYWHLGMVNTAQRFFFEAQEAIPDFQKSARCYKRLAETNIVNRDYKVAGKYLETLQNTLFYRSWARNTARILADSTAISDFPEYVRARELRFKNHDFLFSDREMDSMLGLLFLENRNNSLTYNYLLAWTLLKKDLKRFMECFNLTRFVIAPRHYQEAFLLHWASSHSDFTGITPSIERNTVSRMQSFIKAYKDGRSENYMKDKFGDTYWFYYYYRFNR